MTFSSAGSEDTDGTIATYAWDFGDGTTSSDPDPTPHATPPGDYTATLTVTDDSGDSDVKTIDIVSNPNVLPVAVANSDVSSGNAPLAVQFTGADSVDPDGTITGYSWDFGDGSPLSTDANPSHTYTVAGEYSAVLTVTDSDGDTATAALTIDVDPNPAPTAVVVGGLRSRRRTRRSRSPTRSARLGSSDDGSIVSYSWDFGDGSPAGSGATPTHTYTSVGSFVVTLTVTDNGGLTNSVVDAGEHHPEPGADRRRVGRRRDSGKAPLARARSARPARPTRTAPIVGYSWDFGDGSPISTDANPTHTYGVGQLHRRR